MQFGLRGWGLPPPTLRYGSELDRVMTRPSTQDGTPTANRTLRVRQFAPLPGPAIQVGDASVPPESQAQAVRTAESS
jgi:hypothetical protein